MKTELQDSKSDSGFTFIEMLIVVAIVFLLVALSFPALGRWREKAQMITCNGRLKQVGLAFRIFSGDNTNLFPMALSTNFGGTMELTGRENFFRHWQVISNELGASVILWCPADSRRPTADFAALNNSNISYFIALEASETTPTMPLAGDRNLTNARPVLNGVLNVATNDNIGWTHEMHGMQGNVAMADGSVQSLTSAMLREVVRNSGATNGVLRLAMPE